MVFGAPRQVFRPVLQAYARCDTRSRLLRAHYENTPLSHQGRVSAGPPRPHNSLLPQLKKKKNYKCLLGYQTFRARWLKTIYHNLSVPEKLSPRLSNVVPRHSLYSSNLLNQCGIKAPTRIDARAPSCHLDDTFPVGGGRLLSS